MARYLDLVAELPVGRPVDLADLARRQSAAARALDEVWLAKLPAVQRPLSAGGRDRALRHGDMVLRRLREHRTRISTGYADLRDDELADLLRQSAGTVHAAGRTLDGTAPPIRTSQLIQLESRIRHGYAQPPDPLRRAGGGRGRLRDVTAPVRRTHPARRAERPRVRRRRPDCCRTAPAGAGAGRSGPGRVLVRPPLDTRALLARLPAAPDDPLGLLPGRRTDLRGPGRGAVIAGFANLNHGFWVLLAILTLLRTSAVDTRNALRPVLLGTLLGAAVGSLVLTAGATPEITLVGLPVVMVLTFAVSPLLPQVWGQRSSPCSS